MNDWKKRIGILYSTNQDYKYDYDQEEEVETLVKDKQPLRVSIDKKNRNGKEVTLVSGFVGKEEDIQELCRNLKKKLGIGGSVKEGTIVLQGNQREKTTEILRALGYDKTR